MSKEKKINKKLSIEGLASDIQHKGKSTTTSAFFKSVLLKKLRGLRYGQITISDGPNTFVFGGQHSELRATITVTSQEFYVFLGSGGTLGAAEAYTAGYWFADNLVCLLYTSPSPRDA